jgi:hypothetical protein
MTRNSGELQILRMTEERTFRLGGDSTTIERGIITTGSEIAVIGNAGAAITGTCDCTFGKIAAPILSP